MTDAVCFNCGEIKFGAFVHCPGCGVKPKTDDELALSLGITDHYFDISTLKKIGLSIREGKTPHLEGAMKEDFLREITKLKLTELGDLTIG